MKRLSLFAALVLALLLCSCCTKHEFSPATCTAAATCTKCGETEGNALGHDWAEATCTRVKTCTVCGAEVSRESFTLTPEELEQLYKDGCQSISYDNLSRTPDVYEGTDVKFTGRVVQVCSEATSAEYYSTYRVATSGRYDNVVMIYVDNYGSGTRILEDDWITFYGSYGGLYTYTTVLGASVTIPKIYVEYLD